jgi:molybdopterin/thiamine biosynthesis adenylyltransferase
MNRYDRQQRIAGWDQERLEGSEVMVVGRGWLGTFTAWALASMGVGTILWVGRPRRPAHRLARWFLSDTPFPGSSLYEYPFRVEYKHDLGWAIGSAHVGALVCCSEAPEERAVCRLAAEERQVFWFAGSAAGGGWFGLGDGPHGRAGKDHPVVALAVASVLADAVRETLCPLHEGLLPLDGPLELSPPPRSRKVSGTMQAASEPGCAILVGAGGIGVYAATALAATGHHVHLVDFDRVEETNLNRQGLFSPGDAARGARKSRAAHRALRRLFREASLSSEVRRVDAGYREVLANFEPRPTALLSAVDNARARLVLQEIGAELGLPVIQGGTDTFAADCFTQMPGGPSLDDQMHGALSAAAGREGQRRRRRGGCAGDPSYVVPGMLAGALMAHRFLGLHAGLDDHSPIRWRTGSLPVVQRSVTDGFAFPELVD